MMDEIRFKCTVCGKEHEGLPDLAFDSPIYYGQLPEDERERRAVLTSDTCVIDEEDFFVRACLAIPIKGKGALFVWGVWVSLSKHNFLRYAGFLGKDPPSDEGPYFGWLSNRLPNYPDTLNLKTHLLLQSGRRRPQVELEPTDHPLSAQQREGVELTELLAILGKEFHGSTANSTDAG
jgi:hypothetical protein